jgi:hypothetical protein
MRKPPVATGKPGSAVPADGEEEQVALESPGHLRPPRNKSAEPHACTKQGRPPREEAMTYRSPLAHMLNGRPKACMTTIVGRPASLPAGRPREMASQGKCTLVIFASAQIRPRKSSSLQQAK